MKLLKKVLNFSAERYLKTAGDLFIHHSDYQGALSQVEKALAHDARDTRCLVLYGDILFCLNRDIEALNTFNEALQYDPTLAEAYISKAGILEALGHHREALHCCQQALTYITTKKQYLLPSLFDQKIVLLIRLKRFREAQRVLEKADLYLNEDDLMGLSTDYRGLLEQLCQKRIVSKAKAQQLSLHVLSNTKVSQTVSQFS